LLQGVDGEVVKNDRTRVESDFSGLEESLVELEDDRRRRRRPVLIDEFGVLVGSLHRVHAWVEPAANLKKALISLSK